MSYQDTMLLKLKPGPLALLARKPLMVNGKDVYIVTLKLFTRLIVIGDRELNITDCLCFQLTPLPTAFF